MQNGPSRYTLVRCAVAQPHPLRKADGHVHIPCQKIGLFVKLACVGLCRVISESACIAATGTVVHEHLSVNHCAVHLVYS